MKLELPKVHRAKIMDYCKQYEELSRPKRIKITIPNYLVKICWESDERVSIYDESCSDFNKSSEIVKYNAKIKAFVKSTVKFGKKYFNNQDWLWEAVLWNYRPEQGETIKSLKIEWH